MAGIAGHIPTGLLPPPGGESVDFGGGSQRDHDGLVPAPGAPEASIDDLVVEKDFSNLTVPVTVAVTLVGMSVLLYVIGAITAFFVEGGHTELREQMRIAREVARLRGHVIVCGSGPIGLHAVERLAAEGIPAVVVDGDEAALRRLRERFPGLLFVRGDPTDLEVLLEAGLRSARGVVETLPDDNDSLVVIVTAKQENPGARILAVSTGRETAARLRKAGAHEVVATSFLGGMRIASEAIRPAVVRFLDEAMGHEEEHHGYRFLGLRVGEGSPVSGRTLAASRFAEETGLPVLALRRPGERGFAYNPGPDSVLEPGSVLGVLASDPEEARARAFLSGASPGGGNP